MIDVDSPVDDVEPELLGASSQSGLGDGYRRSSLEQGTMEAMDRELRDWLRGLAEPNGAHATLEAPEELSEEGFEYLARVATDGTLKAAFAELAASEPELAG